MKIFICILLGYLLGSLSPAALISKLKNRSLRKNEAGNLGATDTMVMFGKKFGIIVMAFDIFKACLAVWCARWIAPEFEWLAMLTGLFAVIGHCFPFYLKFKGGKGLAAFGGVILAYDPLFFTFVLTTGVALIIIVNRGTALAYYAALLFPIFVNVTVESTSARVICAILSAFIMIIFAPKLKEAIKGRDFKSRDFIKEQFCKKAKKSS